MDSRLDRVPLCDRAPLAALQGARGDGACHVSGGSLLQILEAHLSWFDNRWRNVLFTALVAFSTGACGAYDGALPLDEETAAVAQEVRGAATASPQPMCCTCGDALEPGDEFAYGDVFYCRADFSRWISVELDKAERDESSYLTFSAGGKNGGRYLALAQTSTEEWREFLTDNVKERIEALEAPLQRKPAAGCCASACDSVINWCVDTARTLKTCSNIFCCLWFCPPKPGSCDSCVTSSICGDPYIERCPKCLTKQQHIDGCPHMKCNADVIRKDRTDVAGVVHQYQARNQVECPACVGSVGCYWGCCFYGAGSVWAIGPCDSCRCRLPCVPCCDDD